MRTWLYSPAGLNSAGERAWFKELGYTNMIISIMALIVKE